VSTKTPSFNDLKPASEVSSRAKRANKHKDTMHEVALRRHLRMLGLRYRKNVETLPGKPDIVFIKAKVAVFCDGDFWHGRDWDTLRVKLDKGTNPEYWIAKIKSNMERDSRNNMLLSEAGWLVIRIWETDIRKDPQKYAEEIKEIVASRLKKKANLTVVEAIL
jgi:DNA mismatch endonuclease (patch repair protein)